MQINRPKSKQPIPTNAAKVFQGKIFSVYQWPQTLFDGTTATFEKVKRIDTVNVIPITPDGNLILSQQEQPGVEPFVGVLGGRINEEESPADAAKRELREESGFEAENIELWFAVQPQEKIDWVIYTFLAKGAKKVSGQVTEGGEKIKLLHLTFDEFIRITAEDNYRDPEISLKIFQAMSEPDKFEELKKLFSGR